MKKKLWFNRFTMPTLLTLFVFGVMAATMIIMSVVAVIAVRVGKIEVFRGPNVLMPILMLFGLSVLLGTTITAFFGRRLLRPLRKVVDAMRAVAGGDFSVRLDEETAVPELRAVTESFNKMAEELGNTETLRSGFISDFSHEFKTPIVSIRGFAKLLRDNRELSQENKTEYADIIVKESERLAKLSASVLELSKLENTEILTNNEEYSLDEQIRRVAALFEPRWNAKHITADIRLCPVSVRADRDLLQRAFTNLIDNAVKFTDANGRISMTLEKKDGTAEFTVSDTGCGMSEQAVRHIFERFYQADSSHASDGSGLGLPMVKRIVELCDGTITVKSEPGRGSSFTVSLPLKDKPLD